MSSINDNYLLHEVLLMTTRYVCIGATLDYIAMIVKQPQIKTPCTFFMLSIYH